MAGGNVEGAIALFFDMQGGGVGGSFITATWPSVPPVGAVTPRDFPAHAVLFGANAAPASWLEQGLEWDTDFASRVGLLQSKNGPCGALAVVNAEARPPPLTAPSIGRRPWPGCSIGPAPSAHSKAPRARVLPFGPGHTPAAPDDNDRALACLADRPPPRHRPALTTTRVSPRRRRRSWLCHRWSLIWTARCRRRARRTTMRSPRRSA